jgi:hypothetical protein
MAVLRAGSGIDRDLTQLGTPFRQKLGNLRFDRFEIEIVRRISDVTTERRYAEPDAPT